MGVLHAVIDGYAVALALLELPAAEGVELRKDVSVLMGVLDVDGVQHDRFPPSMGEVRVREGIGC
jgi:hypothetical protein